MSAPSPRWRGGAISALVVASASALAGPVGDCERALARGRIELCLEDEVALLADVAQVAQDVRERNQGVGGSLHLVRWLHGPEEALRTADRWAAEHPDLATPEALYLERMLAWLELDDREQALQELRAIERDAERIDVNLYDHWAFELGLKRPPYRRWERFTDGEYTLVAQSSRVCRRGPLLLTVAPGQFSLGHARPRPGVPIEALTTQRHERLRRELARVGIEDPGPVELVVYRWREAVTRFPGRRGLEHAAFALPELGRAHDACDLRSLHEDVHVALANHGGLRLDQLLSEGFATALDGVERDLRTQELAAYAARLGSLDEVWMAFFEWPDVVDRLGPPPGGSHAFAASFCAFLLTRLDGRGLDEALRHAGVRSELLERGFGLTESQALDGWQRWLAGEPSSK